MFLSVDIIKIFLDGLSQGAVYALIALGYTMVYGIAKMLNFAHGDIIMVGGYAIFVGITIGQLLFPSQLWLQLQDLL